MNDEIAHLRERIDIIKRNRNELFDENVKLQDENKNLKDVLTEYGRHQPGCPRQYSTDYPCRCGWDREQKQALREVKDGG